MVRSPAVGEPTRRFAGAEGIWGYSLMVFGCVDHHALRTLIHPSTRCQAYSRVGQKFGRDSSDIHGSLNSPLTRQVVLLAVVPTNGTLDCLRLFRQVANMR
ncbi:hypothetical protein M0804_003777 [Polistes exclamans]|nr:hypothetical protein M0804_003777 [Polistes exclamans]